MNKIMENHRMTYNSELDHRRSIRLQRFDYSQPGAYFVTLVAHNRHHLFGEINQNHLKLSLAGQCVDAHIQRLDKSPWLQMNYWVVMPNHVHILCTLKQTPNQDEKENDWETPKFKGTRARSLGAIVQNLKSITARQIHKTSGNSENPVWQRNYYEHVVRDQEDFNRIVEYIQFNPSNWSNDELR